MRYGDVKEYTILLFLYLSIFLVQFITVRIDGEYLRSIANNIRGQFRAFVSSLSKIGPVTSKSAYVNATKSIRVAFLETFIRASLG